MFSLALIGAELVGEPQSLILTEAMFFVFPGFAILF
jgi:hypothetical protein